MFPTSCSTRPDTTRTVTFSFTVHSRNRWSSPGSITSDADARRGAPTAVAALLRRRGDRRGRPVVAAERRRGQVGLVAQAGAWIVGPPIADGDGLGDLRVRHDDRR